jgi:hypothetical protein
MPKLSETQTVLLSAAAARPDHRILPAPEKLKVKGAAFERTVAALLRQGLIAQAGVRKDGSSLKQTLVSDEDRDGADQGGDLIITSTVLDAMGIDPGAANDANPAEEAAPDAPGPVIPQAARPGGKMGLLLDMVSHANGATLGELAAQAGWQSHYADAQIMPM